VLIGAGLQRGQRHKGCWRCPLGRPGGDGACPCAARTIWLPSEEALPVTTVTARADPGLGVTGLLGGPPQSDLPDRRAAQRCGQAPREGGDSQWCLSLRSGSWGHCTGVGASTAPCWAWGPEPAPPRPQTPRKSSPATSLRDCTALPTRVGDGDRHFRWPPGSAVHASLCPRQTSREAGRGWAAAAAPGLWVLFIGEAEVIRSWRRAGDGRAISYHGAIAGKVSEVIISPRRCRVLSVKWGILQGCRWTGPQRRWPHCRARAGKMGRREPRGGHPDPRFLFLPLSLFLVPVQGTVCPALWTSMVPIARYQGMTDLGGQRSRCKGPGAAMGWEPVWLPRGEQGSVQGRHGMDRGVAMSGHAWDSGHRSKQFEKSLEGKEWGTWDSPAFFTPLTLT
jgi:hypothetical protein